MGQLFRTALLSCTVTLTCLTCLTGVAQAQPLAAETRAPNCIEMKTEWGFVQAYNNCDTTKTLNLKAKMAFGPDTKCLPVKPGTRANIGPALGPLRWGSGVPR